MSTMLKYQKNDVLESDFETNQYKVLNQGYLPLLLRDRIRQSEDIAMLSVNEQINAMVANKDAMMEFFTNRCIDISRTNAKFILNALGLPQSSA